MKVIQLKISLCCNTSCHSCCNPSCYNCCSKNHFKYLAEAIENENKYYYRVNGVEIETTQLEYNRVINNPLTYYFSTALRLELDIKKKKRHPYWIRELN